MEEQTNVREINWNERNTGMADSTSTPALPDRWKNVKTVDNALPAPPPFHPEITLKMPVRGLLNTRLCILDAREVKNWKSVFGVSDFWMVLIEVEDGTQMVVNISGEAINKKLAALRDGHKLPVVGMITEKQGKENQYYDLI